MKGLEWLQQAFRTRHFSSHRRPFAAGSPRRRLITPPFAAVCIVDVRNRLQLRGFFFGRRVVQKISTADLRAGEVLEESGFAQWRVDLDVEVETGIRFVCRRL